VPQADRGELEMYRPTPWQLQEEKIYLHKIFSFSTQIPFHEPRMEPFHGTHPNTFFGLLHLQNLGYKDPGN